MKIRYTTILNNTLAILAFFYITLGQAFASDNKDANSINDMAVEAKSVLELELLSQGRVNLITEYGEIIGVKENVKDNNVVNDYMNINLGQANGIKDGDILEVFTPQNLSTTRNSQENDYMVTVGEIKVKKAFDTYSIAIPYTNSEDVLQQGYKVKKKNQPFKVAIIPMKSKDASILTELMQKDLTDELSKSLNLMLIPPKLVGNLTKGIKTNSYDKEYYNKLANKTDADIIISGSIGYEKGNLKAELELWQPKSKGLLAVVQNKIEEKHQEKILQINLQPDLSEKTKDSKVESTSTDTTKNITNNDTTKKPDIPSNPSKIRSVEFQFDADDFTVGDINLDGKDEIIFAAGSIRIYQVAENSLKLLWKGGVAGKHLVFAKMKDESMSELYGAYNYYWYKNGLKSFPLISQDIFPSYYEKDTRNTLLFSTADKRQVQFYGYDKNKYVLESSVDSPIDNISGLYDLDADGTDELIGIKDGAIYGFNPKSDKKYTLSERNELQAVYTANDNRLGKYLLAANDKEVFIYNAASKELEKLWECTYPEEKIFSLAIGNPTDNSEPKVFVGTKKKISFGFATKIYFMPFQKSNN